MALTHEEIRARQIALSKTAVAKMDEWRETAGYTVRETAAVFGINDQSIYATRSEKNPMSLSTLIVLADATGLSLSDLLDPSVPIDGNSEAVRAHVEAFESSASERERQKLLRQSERVQARLADLDSGKTAEPAEKPAGEAKTAEKSGDKAQAEKPAEKPGNKAQAEKPKG